MLGSRRRGARHQTRTDYLEEVGDSSASLVRTAALASEDYPELEEILEERPPLERVKIAAVKPPNPCSLCGIRPATTEVNGADVCDYCAKNRMGRPSDDEEPSQFGEYTAAKDNLVLFHGTRAEAVSGIKDLGLKAPEGVMSSRWPMLTTSREQAERYSHDGTVVEYHVPRRAVWSHDNPGGVLWPGEPHPAYDYPQAMGYSLRDTLPGSYIRAVHSPKTAGVVDRIIQNILPHLQDRGTPSYDWCRFRRNQHCFFPRDLDRNASAQAGYAVWVPFDRGVCPRQMWDDQQSCPISEPGPHSRSPHAQVDATVPWSQGGQHGGQASGERVTLPAHFTALEAKDYAGTVGDPSHITRIETGTVPTESVRHLQGVMGEVPGEHRHRRGADWESFKSDIAQNGIRSPIFITVDHGQEPRISEGNHRRDAAVELGLPEVPVEVRYFGHAERGRRVEAAIQSDWHFPSIESSALHQSRVAQRQDYLGEFIASWKDVRAKAKRIRAEGGVRVVSAPNSTNPYIVGEVQGDHGVYEAVLMRAVGGKAVAAWECSCPWATYSWGRSGRWAKYEGRMCSHALALSFQAQADEMFGGKITEVEHRSVDWQDVPTVQRGEHREQVGAPGPWRVSARQGPVFYHGTNANLSVEMAKTYRTPHFEHGSLYVPRESDPEYRRDSDEIERRIYGKKDDPLKRRHKCKWCHREATKAYRWAEGIAYIPTCDEHEDRTRSCIEDENHDEVAGVVDLPQGDGDDDDNDADDSGGSGGSTGGSDGGATGSGGATSARHEPPIAKVDTAMMPWQGKMVHQPFSAAWSAMGAPQGDDRPEDLHPERYEPNAGFGVHLKHGEIETRRGTSPEGVPIEYDVTPRPWSQRGQYPPERGDGLPMTHSDGQSYHLSRVPGSERPTPHLYRVMHEGEYQQAKERGFIQSDQRMNLADEGTVASDRSTGSFYAAPGPNRIVRIKHHPDDGWRRDHDGYVKTRQPIPFDRVDLVSPIINNDREEREGGGFKNHFSLEGLEHEKTAGSDWSHYIMYHHAPRENRESIQEHGLLPHDPYDPSIHELGPEQAPEGVYLSREPYGPAKRINHDVWRVDTRDMHNLWQDPDDQNDYWGHKYTPDAVDPARLKLKAVRVDPDLAVAPVVHEAASMLREGVPVPEVVEYLSSLGVSNPFTVVASAKTVPFVVKDPSGQKHTVVNYDDDLLVTDEGLHLDDESVTHPNFDLRSGLVVDDPRGRPEDGSERREDVMRQAVRKTADDDFTIAPSFAPKSTFHRSTHFEDLDPDVQRQISDNVKANSPPETGHLTHQKLVDNITNIYRRTKANDPQAHEEGMNWYHHAHDKAMEYAKETGHAPHQMMGAMAALSPRTEWGSNLGTVHYLAQRLAPGSEEKLTVPPHRLYGQTWADDDGIERRHRSGKRFRDMHPHEAACAAFLQSQHEGIWEEEGEVHRVTGEIKRANWSARPNIQKAARILGTDTHPAEHPGDVLGGHKVRSFYNNIVDPDDTHHREDVTMDSHAISVAAGAKFGAGSQNMKRLFDKSNIHQERTNGTRGTYSYFAHAYRDAHHRLVASGEMPADSHPHQLQAVTWTGWRNLTKYMKPGSKGEWPVVSSLMATASSPFKWIIDEDEGEPDPIDVMEDPLAGEPDPDVFSEENQEWHERRPEAPQRRSSSRTYRWTLAAIEGDSAQDRTSLDAATYSQAPVDPRYDQGDVDREPDVSYHQAPSYMSPFAGHLVRQADQPQDVRDYGGGHRPSSAGPPIHDLSLGDNEEYGLPAENMYRHPHHYTFSEHGAQAGRIVQQLRGAHPDTPVTIYRAAPRGVTHINTGDWVSITPGYAANHAMERSGESSRGKLPVYKATVPAKHVRFGGNDLEEWGYQGPSVPAKIHSRGGTDAYTVKTGAVEDPDFEDAMLFEGTYHEEPEPALPSTDGSESEGSPQPETPPSPVWESNHSTAAPNPGCAGPPDFGRPLDPNNYREQMGLPSIDESVLTPGRAPTDPVGGVQDWSRGMDALSSRSGQHGDAEIAAMARRFLKEGAKVFTPKEQQALIHEGGDRVSARNLGDLKIEGTHYEQIEAALRDDEEDASWLA